MENQELNTESEMQIRMNFANQLEAACEYFETLTCLINYDLFNFLIQDKQNFDGIPNTLLMKSQGVIHKSLASSFLFSTRRALRICKQTPGKLKLPRKDRKEFLNKLLPVIAVRNVNEHGSDYKELSERNSSRPSQHIHGKEEASFSLDETCIIVLGKDNILMGPLNLSDIYLPVSKMRNIAGYAALKPSLPQNSASGT